MKFNTSLAILIACALSSVAWADVVSTADKDGDFMAAANWGGIDPKSKPEETFVVSAGHKLLLKTGSKDSRWPVKTVVVSKGAVLGVEANPAFDCSGKTVVLDGGELNMERGLVKNLTLEVRAGSLRAALGGFDGGKVVGKGALEIVRGPGNVRTLTLHDVDFGGYAGKIVVGENMKGTTTLLLTGSSRNLHAAQMEISPPNRQGFRVHFADGVNMLGSFVNKSRFVRLNLGNSACTFANGSSLGPQAAVLLPGVYTPASTSDYSQIPLLKGGFADLKETFEPESLEGSTITILPPAEQKPLYRIDAGSTLTLKEGVSDFSAAGSELLLNGGVLQASGKRSITGRVQLLNHSVVISDEELVFAKGALSGSGNLRLAGKGGRIVFEKEFNLQGFVGTIITEGLAGPTELIFRSGGWGSAKLLLNGKTPVLVSGGDSLQTLGSFAIASDKAKFDLGKGTAVVAAGSRVGDKTLAAGLYTAANSEGFKKVPVTWSERVNKADVFRSGTIDLSPHLAGNASATSATLAVVELQRVVSTATAGSIGSPGSWGGLNPNLLTATQYEIASGHTLNVGTENWQASELAIAKNGALSLDNDLALGGRSLAFHGGTLQCEAAQARTIDGDLLIFDDHLLKDEYHGTLLLNGGDVTVKGCVVGARNKQSALDIRRTKPGAIRLTIAGDMAKVAPTGVGYDVTVTDFAGHLDLVWSQGALNEGYVVFQPKSGTVSSSKGFNSPRGTLRLPANNAVKLDLKNATNTFQIGTAVGGVFIERGLWNEANTAGFTQVPECNTSRKVDITPYLLNTKGAALAISNPSAGVTGKEDDFDMDQIFAPEVAFNPETLQQLRGQFTEELVAPYRKALQTKTPYHMVMGKVFSHSDFTYGMFTHTVFNTYTAYRILDNDPVVFERMMVLADYLQQLLTLDRMATSSEGERKAGWPAPAEQFTCASFTSMTVCALEIWRKELARPGSVDKKLMAKADAYLDFAWNLNEPQNPMAGLKKYLYFDGKLDPATGAPLCVVQQGDWFTWNSASGIWLAAAPLLEAIRVRKLATGKTDWDKAHDVAAKGLTYYMDFFFRDNTVGAIDGKNYVWWAYNTGSNGQKAFVGNGPGWKDGLYKGMKIIKVGEDQAHAKAELFGFHWLHFISPNAYHLTDERMERIANGAFNWLGCSPYGGLRNMFNPYRFELGDTIAPEAGPQGAAYYASQSVFSSPRTYRHIVFNGYKQNKGLQGRLDWLWVKWLYQTKLR